MGFLGEVQVTALTRRDVVVKGLAAGVLMLAAGKMPRALADVATRRLYVAINGSMTIYDVPSWSVVKTVSLPTGDGPRGIVCHPGIGSLWITHGADNGT